MSNLFGIHTNTIQDCLFLNRNGGDADKFGLGHCILSNELLFFNIL